MRLTDVIKSNFVAGMILLAPLVVTLFVLSILMGWLGTLLNPIIQGTRLATFTANNVLLAQALAIVLIVIFVVVIGWIAQRNLGRVLFGWTGQVVNIIPVIRTIYGTVRQMTGAMINRRSDYESVVYVEFPKEGVYRVGLKTGDSPGDIEATAGEQVFNVFMPGSPNPTQGQLLLVPASRTHESELSIREAIRMLMTTGMTEAEDPIGFEPKDDESGNRS